MIGLPHSMNRTIILELPHPLGRIDVDVLFDSRKRITIRVHPDRSVTVRAPVSSGIRRVEAALKSRLGWIAGHLKALTENPPIQQLYHNGSTHYHLGSLYRLMIQRGSRSGVLLKEDEMILNTRVPENRERVRDILRRWYREQTEAIIRDRMPEWRIGLPAHEIRYRWMRRRWGSCSRRGVIVFNTQLVKAPVEYLDFVVAHELCHLLHHNHGIDFRKALEKVMPDWRARRSGLKKLPLML